MTTLAKAKLASSITFIVLVSFTIVTYDRQNMFIIQATGYRDVEEKGGVGQRKFEPKELNGQKGRLPFEILAVR